MKTMKKFDSRVRRYCLVLPVFLLACFVVQAQGTRYVVSVPVANMFSKPSADVDVVSQAIFSTNVDELAEQPGWVKIRTPQDGYTGWVSRADLVELHGSAGYATTGEIAEVEELRSHLYREPDVTTQAPLMTLPFEARLQVLQEKPGGRWLKVQLPDRARGMGAAGRRCLEHERRRGSCPAHDDSADGEVQSTLSGPAVYLGRYFQLWLRLFRLCADADAPARLPDPARCGCAGRVERVCAGQGFKTSRG